MDYRNILSEKIQGIPPSGIRRFFDIAAEMDNVISLGVGEPDFKTPWSIRKAGIESLEQGKTFYSPNAGFAVLKSEICNYLQRRFDLTYTSAETMVTVGGSEGIDALIRALVNPGEEVIIPQPSYVSYEPMTVLAGGVPVIVQLQAQDGFRLTPEALKAAITPKTKLLILPFPGNPTGGVMRREHLEEIAQVLEGTDIMVLSDEIYAELTYDGERHVSIANIPSMKERTVIINGFSKAYAMTGWRLGYAVGPEPIIKEMVKIHQFAIICAPTTSQMAAIEALRNCDHEIERMVEEYNMRRKLMVDSLNKLGLTCFDPEGAFYLFPSIAQTGLTSEDFCQQLLASERLAVVPGSAFGVGGEGFVRISYSYSIQHLTEALGRIERFLKKLQQAK